ncbi:MAG: P-loop NTPase [Propionibacteriales bacterium]|nr:P-loop NTPase [Propionibacteriales bacterium]
MTTSVLLALGGASFESAVVVGLQADDREVRIARRCVDVPDLLAAASTGQARAVLVSPATPHLDADLVAALRSRRVEPIGLVAADRAADEQRLHQIGVRAVLSADGDDLAGRLLAALERAESPFPLGAQPGAHLGAHERVEPEPLREGEVVAVWGPTGAPGRSTVALGLAAELAEAGRSTLLVDADVYGGSQAQMLALIGESSGVLAAARAAKQGTLTVSELAGHARTVAGGLRVLTGLPRADRWPELSESAVDGLLLAARGLAWHVVVDCGFGLEVDEALTFDTAAPRRNGATLQVLDEADTVLAVGSADPVGLTRLARGVVDLRAAVPGASVRVVLNRWRGGLGWSRDEVVATVERLTGSADVVVLPEDRPSCDSCLLHGRTLVEAAPRSRLRLAMRDLVGATAPRREVARR